MYTQLFATVTLALLCTASPVVVSNDHIKLPLTRHSNPTGQSNLLEIDQARARALKSRTRTPPSEVGSAVAAAASSIPATNVATIYTAEITVGNPPTTYNLVVDTGSSNTWVGANTTNPFVPSNTTTDTGDIVLVEYGSGLFAGEEVLDTIAFGGLKVPKQSIGGSKIALGFSGVDGILGIGPTDLTNGTTSGGGLVPTVTDNAFSQGLISAKQIGVSFEPATSSSAANGQLTFGGADTSKFTGELVTVPITSTYPASEYFGIEQSVSYGSTTILSTTSGIVDTGTTLIMLAGDAFAAYTNATGAVTDETTGLLTITADQYDNLESLFFNVGGKNLELTPNAQLWPRALNAYIGGEADTMYLIIGNLGTPSGSGLDFVNGFGFLERYYSLFDTGANTVSFATTQFTNATTN